ncbi:MAG: UvrD-helicase domain-containing protein, partial [Mycobacteriales bacterium]
MTAQLRTAQPRTGQILPEQRESGYVLLRPHASIERAHVPDDQQRGVVRHTSGPLLVEGGPGTGKTFTLLEAVAERVRCGTDPGQILVLTYGRDSATALRNRIVGRIGGVVTEPLARTFHSYAFGLLRHLAAARGEPTPRLLAGPEQDLLIRELLTGDAAGRGVQWPPELSAALKTRGFAAQLRDLLGRAYERGIDPVGLRAWGV